jgi:hypothetical protein
VCHIFLRKNRAYRKSDDPYNLPKVFNRDARARILYTVSDKEFKELHHWSLVGIYCKKKHTRSEFLGDFRNA